MKTSLLILFSIFFFLTSESQSTYINDLTKNYKVLPSEVVVNSVFCINEIDQSAVITNEVDNNVASPFLTFSLFDDDFLMLTQTTIALPAGTIPTGGKLQANDIKRVPKTLPCGTGYIIAGTVNINSDISCGILILIDNAGLVTSSQYYLNVTECIGVEVSSDGFIAICNTVTGKNTDEAKVIKTDCKLNFIWAQQVGNYSGGATCYIPYAKGATNFTCIKAMGKDVFAIAGTAWWMGTPDTRGDMNVVVLAINNAGVIQWENTYGYTGFGDRYEESATAMSIDMSLPDRPQIVLLGESIHKTSNACLPDTNPDVVSNILFALDYGGSVFWAKNIVQSDRTDDLRRMRDLICYGDMIGICGNTKPNGWLYSVPAVYRFDRRGTFIEERYYDDGAGTYTVDALNDHSKINKNSHSDLAVIGTLKTDDVLIIQSYTNITDRCEMLYENIDVTVIAMPSIDLPQNKVEIPGQPIDFVSYKDDWKETLRCKKTPK